MVSILVSSINRISAAAINHYLTVLPSFEVERLNRLKHVNDFKLGLLGKMLLCAGLNLYGFGVEGMRCLRYGGTYKPFIQQGPWFNISHSGEYAVCALSESCEVGVDIEMIREIQLGEFASQWTKREWDAIITAPNPLRMFYHYWTRKESVIKADGTGLGIPLQGFDVSASAVFCNGKQWYLSEQVIDRNYSCHLATPIPESQVDLKKLEFMNDTPFWQSEYCD